MATATTGLYDLELDLDQLTAAKDQAEAQLDREAEALRSLKAQNEQVAAVAITATAAAVAAAATTEAAVPASSTPHPTPHGQYPMPVTTLHPMQLLSVLLPAHLAPPALTLLPHAAPPAQARATLASSGAAVSQLYTLLGQEAAAATAQLDVTAAALQAATAARTAAAAAAPPLGPGPNQAWMWLLRSAVGKRCYGTHGGGLCGWRRRVLVGWGGVGWGGIQIDQVQIDHIQIDQTNQTAA